MKSIQKTVFLLLSLFLLAAFPQAAFAQNGAQTQLRNQIEERMEQRVEQRTEQQTQTQTENRNEDTQISVQQRIQERVTQQINRLFKRTTVVLRNAQVTAVGESSISVKEGEKTYTVNLNSATKLRRHYWGQGNIEDIEVGHSVNIIGTWANEEQTVIDAKMIRDLSIQKRFGVFIGIIESLTGNTITFETVNKGKMTVTVDESTELVDRSQESISLDEIKNGHRIRVKGLWDKTQATITEVTQIKDFSLPVKTEVSR